MTMVPQSIENWLGRVEEASGWITQELSDRLRATIDPVGSLQGVVPFGVHWCTALAPAPNSAIGVDGHPAKGGFLPPVQLPNRMWASSEIVFLDQLVVDDHVTRQSKIADIAFKDGRSGPLCFVTVDHQWRTSRGAAITESQHIVYRDPAKGVAAPSEAPVARPDVWDDAAFSLSPDPVMLFRYSALTFNAHRIHYDRDYAVGEEGYPERVVHGPLQATLLMNHAALKYGPLKRFSFRAKRPAFAGDRLDLVMPEISGRNVLQTHNARGETCMEAEVE